MNYKFLLFISYSYAVPIGHPLELEIKKRGFEVKWYTYIDATKASIPQNSTLLNTIQEVVAYNPDIILTIADYAPDFLSGLKVQVFHGFNPAKRGEDDHFNIRGFFDLYCTQGPSTTNRFLLEQAKHPHFEVVETGWPKMDPLFTPHVVVSHPRPVILITSTFSHRLSLALKDEVYEEIKRLSLLGKYDFIAVLHPKLPSEIFDKWRQLNNEHFEFKDTTDLIPLFLKADIMLSDTTSAIQEFMLTGKPIVTFCHKKPNPCVIDVTSPEDLQPALDKALSGPSEQLAAIRKEADYNHPHRDGASSRRVIDSCIDMLNRDKSHLRRKPLNLIRKYKIRKLLHYYTFKSFRKPTSRSKN